MLPDAARQRQTFSEENPPLQISPEPILTGGNVSCSAGTVALEWRHGNLFTMIVVYLHSNAEWRERKILATISPVTVNPVLIYARLHSCVEMVERSEFLRNMWTTEYYDGL